MRIRFTAALIFYQISPILTVTYETDRRHIPHNEKTSVLIYYYDLFIHDAAFNLDGYAVVSV
jgi:hypothetical protein